MAVAPLVSPLGVGGLGVGAGDGTGVGATVGVSVRGDVLHACEAHQGRAGCGANPHECVLWDVAKRFENPWHVHCQSLHGLPGSASSSVAPPLSASIASLAPRAVCSTSVLRPPPAANS